MEVKENRHSKKYFLPVCLLLLLSSTSAMYQFRSTEATVRQIIKEVSKRTGGNEDPCRGRPSPPEISTSSPPGVFFLHIPKTAGTLLHHFLIGYANKTSGLPCQFLHDGNRLGTEHYHMSINPPPKFEPGSLAWKAVNAYKSRNYSAKKELFKNGACRVVRGHVTFWHNLQVEKPMISVTVLRHPIERFISMYEFVLMMIKTQPNIRGWNLWFSNRTVQDELNDESSLLHQGFYDTQGRWIEKSWKGLSFHFYGVLHQLSGAIPIFKGVGSISGFQMENAAALKDLAKNNLCASHVVGIQENMKNVLSVLSKELKPFATWEREEKARVASSRVNKNFLKRRTEGRDILSDVHKKLLETRLKEELEVYEFAERIVKYRFLRGAMPNQV